ncbi:MAG: NosD domain-containing protein [Myxococcota bacterium]
MRGRAACPRVAVALLTAGLLLGAPATAVSFSVNSTGDLGDNSIGDGDCWTGGWVQIGMFGVFECTLRAAIQETNALVGHDTIGFGSPLTPDVFGTIVIAPTSALPAIDDPLTLDGTSAPGYATADPDAVPVVVIDGSLSPSSFDRGVYLTSGADGSEVHALSVVDWTWYGIYVNSADDVVLQGNHVGVEHGVLVGGNGTGIFTSQSANNVTIGPTFNALVGFQGRGNLVAGSAGDGLLLFGPNAKVAGNKIGTDRFGNASGAFGNGGWGVRVDDLAHGARIGRVEGLAGGGEAALGNVIAGNAFGGVFLDGTPVSPSHVLANHIGIGADGTTALGNGTGHGVMVLADDSVVGDEDLGGNLISGHQAAGLRIGTTGQPAIDGVEIVGNTIGLDASHAADRGNGGSGIILPAATGAAIHGNTIGANAVCGVNLQGGSSGNDVYDNDIGSNAAGDDFGNATCGIHDAGTLNALGLAGQGNVIGFNETGILVASSAVFTFVEGNFIGTDASGADLGNDLFGIEAFSFVAVGGVPAGSGNVIGFNGLDGIYLHASSAGSVITGNHIGTNPSGADLGNGDAGVTVDGSLDTSVGASRFVTTPSQVLDRRNVIAYNGSSGVAISGATAAGNTVRGNEMFDNRGLPIDLVPFGPTPNDPGDSDLGTNAYQNAPELDAAGTSFDQVLNVLTVEYRVDSHPTFSPYPLTVDFYRLASDAEETRQWVGSDSYPQASAGLPRQVGFTPETPLLPSDSILAVATDDDGNSSEAGNVVAVPEPAVGAGLAFGTGLLLALARRRR